MLINLEDIELDYRVLRFDDGTVFSVVRDHDGAALIFDPETKTFDEEHFLTKELRAWETENDPLDLSDQPPEEIPLEEIKAQKKQEIFSLAKSAQDALTSKYATAEQVSWNRKLAEAEQILADQDIESAPMLKIEAIATSEITTDEDILQATLDLAVIIKEKSETLYQLSAEIAGKRANLAAKVEAATTLVEIENILIEF